MSSGKGSRRHAEAEVKLQQWPWVEARCATILMNTMNLCGPAKHGIHSRGSAIREEPATYLSISVSNCPAKWLHIWIVFAMADWCTHSLQERFSGWFCRKTL